MDLVVVLEKKGLWSAWEYYRHKVLRKTLKRCPKKAGGEDDVPPPPKEKKKKGLNVEPPPLPRKPRKRALKGEEPPLNSQAFPDRRRALKPGQEDVWAEAQRMFQQRIAEREEAQQVV